VTGGLYKELLLDHFRNPRNKGELGGADMIRRGSSTATAQWHALSGFCSVGVLDIVSTMPARSSVAETSHAAPLNRFATNGGEKCGLFPGIPNPLPSQFHGFFSFG
jgi:hypothetical protein